MFVVSLCCDGNQFNYLPSFGGISLTKTVTIVFIHWRIKPNQTLCSFILIWKAQKVPRKLTFPVQYKPQHCLIWFTLWRSKIERVRNLMFSGWIYGEAEKPLFLAFMAPNASRACCNLCTDTIKIDLSNLQIRPKQSKRF